MRLENWLGTNCYGELLKLETVLLSLYLQRAGNPVDALLMLLKWSESLPSFFWITAVTFSGPSAFTPAACSLQSTGVVVLKHKLDHVTPLLISFLTTFPLAHSDPAVLTSLLFLRHARHFPALRLLHWLFSLPAKLLSQISILPPTPFLQVFARISPQWHLPWTCFLKLQTCSTTALWMSLILLYLLLFIVLIIF